MASAAHKIRTYVWEDILPIVRAALECIARIQFRISFLLAYPPRKYHVISTSTRSLDPAQLPCLALAASKAKIP
jgi:hypothetical protein